MRFLIPPTSRKSKILRLANDKCLLGEEKWDEMEKLELALA